LIGKIIVHRQNGDGTWTLRGEIDVLATVDLLEGDTVEAPAQAASFTLCEFGSCQWQYRVKYSFWNSGATTVYLDYYKAYDDMGNRVLNGEFDNAIRAAVNEAGTWKDSVDFWWLRDEPRYDHFMPWGHVRSVVNDETDTLSSITALYLPPLWPDFDHTKKALALRSFVELTGQDKLVFNDYPFQGGYNSFFTDYTGYADEPTEPNGHRGLQKQLELLSYDIYDIFSQEIETGSTLKELWCSPQCFFQVWDSSAGYDYPNTMYFWRPPTPSELRLSLYLPMCYHVKGFALWGYHWGQSSDPADPGMPRYSYGFYISDTGRNESMWEVFAEDITPYIKAIDSTYLGLEWQRAYPVKQGFITPPTGAYVSSIKAVSLDEGGGLILEDEGINPDRGWFHAGEYTITGEDDKYLMIVNRACSQGEYNSTQAPSVLATVRLDPANLGLGDYVYVIDIANSATFTGGEWRAVPETTYTAKMADGKIPFTTVLRAGEGGLFKLTTFKSE
jgi:hypothetical protein